MKIEMGLSIGLVGATWLVFDDVSETECREIAALIEQQDKMIELACDRLSNFRKCPPEVCDLPYHPGDVECCKHWRKWLEKEAGVQ